MTLIVGLGNIGSEYDGTRHNIGFEIVDSIADSLSVSFEAGGGPFTKAEGRYKGRKIVLIKPTTYMNRSGTAVKKALAKFNIETNDCLIIYDDLNLPLGTNRMKAKGSAGGHNGISDIIERLGHNNFARLRIGIGDNFSRGKQVDYVLSPFDENELDDKNRAVKNASEAALAFANIGIERAMNYFN